jgi:hypothetical protein
MKRSKFPLILSNAVSLASGIAVITNGDKNLTLAYIDETGKSYDINNTIMLK